MENKFHLNNCTVLIVLAMAFNCSCAQQDYKPGNHRNVYLTPGGKKTETVITVSKIKAKSDKSYYWYDNTNIQETQGGYSGYLLDGSYTEFLYPSNKLSTRGSFKKGLKNGIWTIWYENGKIKEQTQWHKGVLDGKKQTYNTQGLVTQIEWYEEGKFKSYLPLTDTTKHTHFPQKQANDVSRFFRHMFVKTKPAKTEATITKSKK